MTSAPEEVFVEEEPRCNSWKAEPGQKMRKRGWRRAAGQELIGEASAEADLTRARSILLDFALGMDPYLRVWRQEDGGLRCHSVGARSSTDACYYVDLRRDLLLAVFTRTGMGSRHTSKHILHRVCSGAVSNLRVACGSSWCIRVRRERRGGGRRRGIIIRKKREHQQSATRHM